MLPVACDVCPPHGPRQLLILFLRLSFPPPLAVGELRRSAKKRRYSTHLYE